ncbi:DUF4231 domain-containing protein [uncultured Desulfobacter sp.]|uniref:DUF4231 domain-containing protein n=1 Tax=uncultured Desulfobacter sp. TaxID=240139 RepID=UPI002AA85013|nr:DUF4231 domain-containing protein [uncultured Desulfobacter sp.]
MSNANNVKNINQSHAHNNTWGEYRVWAATARRIKTTLQSCRRVVLYLTLFSAAVGAFAEQYPKIAGQLKPWLGGHIIADWVQPVLGCIAGLAIAIAGIIMQRLASRRNQEEQVRARSTAEALKSQTYLYVTGTPPYDADDPQTRLYDETDQLVQQVEKEIISEVLSDEKRLKRRPEYPMPVETYIKQRVENQIQWYRRSTTEHGKKVKQAQYWSIVFAIAGFILSGLSGLSGISPQWGWLGLMPGWIPVIGAFSAAMASHFYAERHEYLQLSYRATGRRLTRLLERFTNREDSTSRRTFITNCENTISIENQSWMAELLEDKDMPATDTDPNA